MTDENGRFTLRGLAEGPVNLSVYVPGRGWSGGAAVKEDQPTVRVTVKPEGD